MYGTGWMGGRAPAPGQWAPQNENTQTAPGGGYYQNQYNTAAPPYSPPVKNNGTGNTFTSGDGYYGQGAYGNPYGGQQSGIELQPPSSSYQPQRGGAPVYEAPLGAPPVKGDGIVR